MQLLAGCIQPVPKYILQNGGINQIIKECADKGIQYNKTMDQTQALNKKRADNDKGTLASCHLNREDKQREPERESLKQANERLNKDNVTMRLQFQRLSKPAETEKKMKSVNFTKKKSRQGTK